jgi:hypothetical protein
MEHNMTDLPFEKVVDVISQRRKIFLRDLTIDHSFTEMEREHLGLLLRSDGPLDMATTMYAAYPCLFRGAFNPIEDHNLLELAWASRCALDHVILYDAIIDSSNPDPMMMFACFRFRDAYRSSLQRLFGPEHQIWVLHDRFEAQAIQALKREALRRSGNADFDKDMYLIDAIAKSALSKLVLYALAFMTPAFMTPVLESSVLVDLLDSSDAFYAGHQVMDDLMDWRGDFRSGTVSYLLAMALDVSQTDLTVANENTTGAIIYQQVAPKWLIESQVQFARSEQLACRHLESDSLWLRMIQSQRAQATKLMATLDMSIKPMKSSSISVRVSTRDRLQQSMRHGLRFVLEDIKKGHTDLVHSMVFPRSEGFTTGGISNGAIFQRAILCRFLALASNHSLVDPSGSQLELQYLRDHQDPGSGGWKYFPSLQELPADADDVAQVLLAFIEANATDTSHLFTKVLGLIQSLTEEHGPEVPSWLVPTDLQNPEVAAYRLASDRWWGSGADVEVVANLAYALLRLDRQIWGDFAESAANWIADQQSDNGSWGGVWYWGRTYASWMALRLIDAVFPDHPSILSLRSWWLERRVDHCRSATEAAFALEIGGLLVQKGWLAGCELMPLIDHLTSVQAEDGGWDATPWIRMDINRASVQRGEGRPRYLSYGTRTMSALLCTQALLNISLISDFDLPHLQEMNQQKKSA